MNLDESEVIFIHLLLFGLGFGKKGGLQGTVAKLFNAGVCKTSIRGFESRRRYNELGRSINVLLYRNYDYTLTTPFSRVIRRVRHESNSLLI